MMHAQLAWRYASRRLVNYIAVLALALALTVQIVAMSVLDGMLVDLSKRLRNMGEQITLSVSGRLPGREDFDAVDRVLREKIPGVAGLTPLLQKVGFLQTPTGAEYVWAQGIDLRRELAHSSLPRHLLTYRPDAANPGWGGTGELPPVFMGEQLARRLGVNAGAEVELYSADRDASGALQTRSKRFQITSLYRSGVFEKDRYGIYLPIEEAGEFYLAAEYDDPRDRVETFVVWLDDPERAAALEGEVADVAAAALRERTGEYPDISSDTWQRRWEQAAQGMKHENNLMELVLFLNDAASGFCVFAILVTLVSRRVRDVGLLRCIGSSRGGVMAVFLMVGLVIGAFGGLLGVAGGVFLAGPSITETAEGETRLAGGGAAAAELRPGEDASSRRPRIDRYYEQLTGQPLYPPRMFGIADETGLPTVMYPWKLALYFFAAVFVSVAAALYPAVWAAWREPMSALREG